MEVCVLFDDKYPDREITPQSTVSKIENKETHETGLLTDFPKGSRRPVGENKTLCSASVLPYNFTASINRC